MTNTTLLNAIITGDIEKALEWAKARKWELDEHENDDFFAEMGSFFFNTPNSDEAAMALSEGEWFWGHDGEGFSIDIEQL